MRALGAEPAVLDVLDREAVRRLVLDTKPDAIVHQATALAGGIDFKHFAESFARTNQLRTEGTDNLLAAAKEANVRRFVAQSYAGWPLARVGGPVKTEEDPLDDDPPEGVRSTVAAIKHLESAVVDAGGIALRYGSFYGAPVDPALDAIRERKVPIVGDGGGMWSFVHVEDAASATVLALERGKPGVYNVTDDDPAPARDVLPALAEAVGAPAAAEGAGLAREAVRRRARRRDDDAAPRRLEREGEAGARLDAPLSELARGVRGAGSRRARRLSAKTARPGAGP